MKDKILVPVKASEELPPVINKFYYAYWIVAPVAFAGAETIIRRLENGQYEIDSSEFISEDEFKNRYIWYKEVSIDELLPSYKEIDSEANSYDNCMASLDESIWIPAGFKKGANFVSNHIKNKLK